MSQLFTRDGLLLLVFLPLVFAYYLLSILHNVLIILSHLIKFPLCKFCVQERIFVRFVCYVQIPKIGPGSRWQVVDVQKSKVLKYLLELRVLNLMVMFIFLKIGKALF